MFRNVKIHYRKTKIQNVINSEFISFIVLMLYRAYMNCRYISVHKYTYNRIKWSNYLGQKNFILEENKDISVPTKLRY